MPVLQIDPPDPDFPMPKKWWAWWKRFKLWLIGYRPVAGDGVTLTDAPGGGMSISVTGAATTATAARGFKCTSTTLSGSPAILVKYGVVNSITPDGMTLGDIPPYVIAAEGDTGVVCLGVTVGESGDPDQGIANQAFIQCFEDTMPDDAEPIFYQQIGSYVTTDGAFTVTTDGDGIGYQSFELCGNLGGVAQWGPA